MGVEVEAGVAGVAVVVEERASRPQRQRHPLRSTARRGSGRDGTVRLCSRRVGPQGVGVEVEAGVAGVAVVMEERASRPQRQRHPQRSTARRGSGRDGTVRLCSRRVGPFGTMRAAPAAPSIFTTPHTASAEEEKVGEWSGRLG